jgi:hypothetical protein
MKALSEDASEPSQATNYLNRSAGRLEDRHQISVSAHALAKSEPEVVHVNVYDESSTEASRARVSRAQLGWGMLMPVGDDKMSPRS